MKKLIICFLFATTMINAADKLKQEKIVVNKENGTCTVTMSYTDSDGKTYTGTGTAETCSEAKKKALNQILNSPTVSIQ